MSTSKTPTPDPVARQSVSAIDPWNNPPSSSEIPNILFILKENRREKIVSADLEKIGQGGTAIVFLVKSGAYAGHVVKIYNDALLGKRREELKNKVKMMLSSPPESAEIKLDTTSIPQFNWPVALAEDDKGSFCGLVLPYINFKDAYDLTSYLLNVGTLDEKHQSITERMQVARNLAAAVATLHKAGHYFVDMKPQNIFVLKGTSTVTFIDCDGFSINRGEFPARHISPGYIAPEELDSRPVQLSESPEQDNYVLAVLIFQLLDYDLLV